MELYDALMYLGRRRGLEDFRHSTVESLSKALDKYGISNATLVSFMCEYPNVDQGNERVFAAADQDDRVSPAPAVLPNAGAEIGDEADHVDGLIERGARCVCFYPKTHGTTLDDRVIGPLFAALNERRLAVLLFETDWLEAADLANRYPQVPVIIPIAKCRNRTWLAAMKSASNLHFTTAPNFAQHRAMEVVCQQVGPERMLFGTSYPVSEPGAAITHLLRSSLDDEQVALIASGNMKRLTGGVSVSATPARKARAKRPERSAEGLRKHIRRREPLPWDGIVDMHAHLGNYSGFPIWGGMAEGLIEELDRVGIQKTFVSHESCASPESPWGNDQVLAAVEQFPDRILGYATAYPINDELGIDEVTRAVGAGLHGIKLHNSSMIPYDTKYCRPIFEYADAMNIPILLHTWGDIDKYDEIFQWCRKAPLLLGHSGASNSQLYVQYARKHPNVYLELCYSGAPYRLVEHFVAEVGAERVLFGSDAAWMTFSQQIGRIIFADITEEQMRTILVDNPKRILDGARR